MSFSPVVPAFSLSGLPRGNLLLQSQTFDNAAWVKTLGTITANNTTDIYGLSTADKWTRTSASASYCGQSVTLPAVAKAYTFSIYVKISSGNFFPIAINGGTGRADACFNLSTGATTLATASGTFSGVSASLVAVPGAAGYFRAQITVTTAGETSVTFYFSSSSVSQVVDGTGSANSTTVFVWGAQLEPYSQASAYALTTTTADPGIWAGVQGLNVFPYLPGQAINVGKSPEWNVQVVESTSGRERRTNYWNNPKWNFNFGYEVVRHRQPSNDELFKLWEFFNLAGGEYAPWLFVDPWDNYIQPSAPSVFGTGDSATTTFQLARQMNSYLEPVYDVYQPIILDNGVLTASSLTFAPNGQVTFGTPPATGHTLSWFGYFYFGCRFDQGELPFEQIVPALWGGKGIKFKSLRV